MPRHQLTKRENARGGRRAHARGHARQWTREEAAAAGRKSAEERARILATARSILEGSADQLAIDYLLASATAAERGDHVPARDMLDRLDVTRAVPQQQTNVGVSVQITGFTLPGLPVPRGADGRVPCIEPPAAADAAANTLPGATPVEFSPTST